MPRGVKTRRRPAELDLGALADQVIGAIGQPVSIALHVDPDGLAVLDVLHPTENVEIPIDLDELLRIVDQHVRPPAPPDLLDALIEELGRATTVDGVSAAVAKWATRERGRRPGRQNGSA